MQSDTRPFDPNELLRSFHLAKWATRIFVYVAVTLLIPFDHYLHGLTWDQAISVHLGGYVIATLAIELAFGYTFKLRRRGAYPNALLVRMGGARNVREASRDAVSMIVPLLKADRGVIALTRDGVLEPIESYPINASGREMMESHRALAEEALSQNEVRVGKAGSRRVVAVPATALHGPVGVLLVQGSSRVSLLKDSPLLDSLGTALGLSLESLRQTEELKESEQRLRTVVTGAPIILTIADRDGVLTLAEGKALQSFAIQPEDIVGRHIDDVFSQRPELLDAFNRALQGEAVTLIADTSRMVLEARVAPYHDGQGRLLGVRAVAWDVTEREAAQRSLRDSEARFRALIENASDFIVILSKSGTIEYGSPSIERVLGYSLDEILEGSVFDFIHPDEVSQMRETFALRLRVGGVGVPIEFRALHKDGSWRTIEAIGNFSLVDDPMIQGAVFNARDVTERKQAEMAMAESEARFRSLFQSAGDAIYTLSLDGKITSLNPSFEALTGWNVEDWLGKNFAPIMHPEDLASAVEALGRLARNDLPPMDTFEWRILKRNGDYMTGEFVVRPIYESGKLAGVLGIARDITERKQAENTIKYMAEHDQLTGLLNRSSFEERMRQSLAEAEESERPVALLFLDVDCFKGVNDTLGHEAGDRLLQDIAGQLRECVRDDDALGRYGGDEFLLLLDRLERPDDVEDVAKRLLDSIRTPRRVADRDVEITASIGIALFPHSGQDAETVLRSADAAMYRAKELGRNNYQFCSRVAASRNANLEGTPVAGPSRQSQAP